MWVSPTPLLGHRLAAHRTPVRVSDDSTIAQPELDAGTQPTSSLLSPSKPRLHSPPDLWCGVGWGEAGQLSLSPAHKGRSQGQR